MNRLRYLQRMGVPLWRLRRPVAITHADNSEPAVRAPATRAEEPCLWAGIEPGGAGQQLVDELVQALGMMGRAMPVQYDPGAAAGIRLGAVQSPSMERLLAEPALKAALWRALCEWLDERAESGGTEHG